MGGGGGGDMQTTIVIHLSPPSLLLSLFPSLSEVDYQRVRKMADKVEELTDLQDELHVKTSALDKAEKAAQR